MHGCGVVVHHHRGLGAAQPGQQAAHCGLARAALAGGEVELDVDGLRGVVQRQRGPAQVRVQQHPGGVHHGRQQQPSLVLGAGQRGRGGPVLGPVGDGSASEFHAHRVRQPAGRHGARERRRHSAVGGSSLIGRRVPGLRTLGPMLPVPIVRLDPDLPLPAYAHPGDAGLDLRAREDGVVAPGGGRLLMPTGIAIAIPVGHAGFVLPRAVTP